MERQNKIKTKRIEVGYVQYKVAEMLGISTRHYARIENYERNPTEKEIRQLAKIFKCKKADLIERRN
ncbi:MAG: helix-turn-helix transcriptional regulator [Cetobacterium sp.]